MLLIRGARNPCRPAWGEWGVGRQQDFGGQDMKGGRRDDKESEVTGFKNCMAGAWAVIKSADAVIEL